MLAELIAVYAVNVQRIGEEWLAFKDHVGGWGESPQQAACRWVVQYHFGKELASAK